MTANGDTVTGVTLTSTGAPAAAAVGSYPIVPSAAVGSGLSNYTITYENGTLTVTPGGTLTITATNASKIYGQTLSFAGTEFTVTGLQNGDTVTSVTLSSTGAAQSATVSAYPIVVSAAVGSGLGNYTIVYDTGTLTVNPAPLSITANNTGKAVGTTKTFAGTEFTESGLVTTNGDTVTSVTLTSTGARRGRCGRGLSHRAQRRGGHEAGQLHDHLQHRQPDGRPRGADADHLGQEREQGLRADALVRRNRVYGDRTGEWRLGHERHALEPGGGPVGNGGHLSHRGQRCGGLGTGQLHDRLRYRHAHGDPGAALDHGR